MSQTSLVSVIIPVFNRGDLVACALESVLRQTYRNYEVLVVDDGSTDNTREVLDSFGESVKVLYQSNKGPYAARNLGLRHAGGEYIAFLDSDDTWLPEKLTKQVSILDSDPEIGLVFGNGELVDESNRKRRLTFFAYYRRQARGWIFSELTHYNFIPQSSVLVRRKCFEEFGPFLELPLAADYHKWLQISLSYKIDFVEEVVFRYSIHAGRISRDRVSVYRYVLKIFDDLAGSVSDPANLTLLRKRVVETEYRLGLIYLQEGIQTLLKTLFRPVEGSRIGGRCLCLARILSGYVALALRRQLSHLHL